MLFTIDQNSKTAAEVARSTFADMTLKERFDIQEWILACPQLLGEDLLIVTAEFDRFDRTSERLDLLAVDKRGKLVVIELKRTAVGSKADLQALRYAAYCSTLGIEDLAELHAAHLKQRTQQDRTATEAREAIIEFLENPEFEEFDDQPRIILAAEEFPAEITATMLWLRTFDIDISAVRLRPYQVAGQLLVDCTVIIPLPEAEAYIIRRERKDVRKQREARGRGEAYLPWFQALIDSLREDHQFTNARVAQPQNWYSFASGFSRIAYAAVFTQQGLRAEIYLNLQEREENKQLFDTLFAEHEEIDREFGEPLSWERMDERQASRVGIYRETTIASPPDELEIAREWAIETLLRLKKVFSPRVEALLR